MASGVASTIDMIRALYELAAAIEDHELEQKMKRGAYAGATSMMGGIMPRIMGETPASNEVQEALTENAVEMVRTKKQPVQAAKKRNYPRIADDVWATWTSEQRKTYLRTGKKPDDK